MKHIREVEFTKKVLRTMKIDSYFISISQLPPAIRQKIRRKKAICIISDENGFNYVLCELAENTQADILICGPYITEDFMGGDDRNAPIIKDETIITALFSALGESLWGGEYFTIKKYNETHGMFSENNEIHSFKKYSQHVQKAIGLIESDLTQELSLKSVSRILGMNPSYFSALFSEETGKTFTDYVNFQRIEFAKKMLRTSSLQIQTIAQHCGILDVNYFTKLFRKYTGVSPSYFRNCEK